MKKLLLFAFWLVSITFTYYLGVQNSNHSSIFHVIDQKTHFYKNPSDKPKAKPKEPTK